jgi:hypothetical protein
MPAHTFMRVGDYHEAGVANERAIALYERYLANDPPGHATYFYHDCAFGVDAFMMAGEYARAQRIAADCGSYAASLTAHVDLRFRRWDALAAAAADDDFIAGMVAANAARYDDAAKHLAELRKLKGNVVTIEADVVAASIEEAKHDDGGAIAALQEAVREQDESGYAEPPSFFYPVRESLGGALYRAGRYAEAEQTFRDDLAHDAGNPRALFGLAETLEREGRSGAASDVRARFAQAWAEADSSLDMKDY